MMCLPLPLLSCPPPQAAVSWWSLSRPGPLPSSDKLAMACLRPSLHENKYLLCPALVVIVTLHGAEEPFFIWSRHSNVEAKYTSQAMDA